MATLHWQQLLEKAYPYLWAFAVAAVVHRYGPVFDLQLSETQISTTTTIASILMGFLGTSYGILLSATSKRIEWAKGRQCIWQSILRFFNESFVANFSLCVYSIALAFLFTHPLSAPYQGMMLTGWSFLIVLSMISFFRAMRVLFGLLRTDT